MTTDIEYQKLIQDTIEQVELVVDQSTEIALFLSLYKEAFMKTATFIKDKGNDDSKAFVEAIEHQLIEKTKEVVGGKWQFKSMLGK